MAVSKRLRYEILRRDNHTCRYCGATAPDAPLRIDHVTPVALGGADTPDNLVTACQDCNSGKSSATADATVIADVSQDALRWAEAMKQAAANLLEQEQPKQEYRAAFLAEWNRWGLGEGDERKPLPLPGEWKASIERFHIAGLPDWVWAEIVDTAMGYSTVKPENKFKYCCGIAWNKVTAMQEDARRLVAPKAPIAADNTSLDALTTLVVAAWVDATGETPTQEQRDELARTATEALNEGHDPDFVIKASREAGSVGYSNIQVGFESLEHDRKYQVYQLWANTWVATIGSYPEQDDYTAFGDHCKRLYDVGARVSELKTAAVVAGYHLSTVPHYGVTCEHLNAAGINWRKQFAIDVWVSTFTASASRWPTADERRKFDAQLERLTDDGGFLVFDAHAAAAAAGAAQEADLYWNVPRKLSALLAASSPMQRSDS